MSVSLHRGPVDRLASELAQLEEKAALVAGGRSWLREFPEHPIQSAKETKALLLRPFARAR